MLLPFCTSLSSVLLLTEEHLLISTCLEMHAMHIKRCEKIPKETRGEILVFLVNLIYFKILLYNT